MMNHSVWICFNDGKGYQERQALLGDFLLPDMDKPTTCKIIAIQGNLWDRECDVYLDPDVDEMYRCRYAVGKPPITDMSFHLEITGTKWAFSRGYYTTACRIVVPHPERNAWEVETFCGKVRIAVLS